jgi:hypothetical protein
MNLNQTALELARVRQEELIAEAAQARLVEQRPSTIRRFVGRRVIAVGQRIAAEPHLELARSR